MPLIPIRNAATALVLISTACSTGPHHPARHADEAARLPEAEPSSLSAAATEASSAPAPTRAESHANSGAELEGQTSAEPQAGLVIECQEESKPCLPPAYLVDRLCRAAHVGTAIRLFAKGSPLTRGYVRMREVRAANLRGGPVGDANLTFAEEVLILAQHGGSGEMQVSGVGGFDVLRWDGTCATLSHDELVMQVPARPRHAQFAWKYIDDGIQEALLQNEAIRSARAVERKRCRGMSPSQSSASCREAAERLNEHIVIAVRTGMDLPVAEYAP